jgi:hypothetical protein
MACLKVLTLAAFMLLASASSAAADGPGKALKGWGCYDVCKDKCYNEVQEKCKEKPIEVEECKDVKYIVYEEECKNECGGWKHKGKGLRKLFQSYAFAGASAYASGGGQAYASSSAYASGGSSYAGALAKAKSHDYDDDCKKVCKFVPVEKTKTECKKVTKYIKKCEDEIVTVCKKECKPSCKDDYGKKGR